MKSCPAPFLPVFSFVGYGGSYGPGDIELLVCEAMVASFICVLAFRHFVRSAKVRRVQCFLRQFFGGISGTLKIRVSSLWPCTLNYLSKSKHGVFLGASKAIV